MNSQKSPAACHVPSGRELKNFVVKRDGNRPISFTGQALAKVEMASSRTTMLAAALYKARGGKFVAALSRRRTLTPALELEGAEPAREDFDRARVFDNFDEAIAWFRPSRLTDTLRQQLEKHS